jgi:hypothetical protein
MPCSRPGRRESSRSCACSAPARTSADALVAPTRARGRNSGLPLLHGPRRSPEPNFRHELRRGDRLRVDARGATWPALPARVVARDRRRRRHTTCSAGALSRDQSRTDCARRGRSRRRVPRRARRGSRRCATQPARFTARRARSARATREWTTGRTSTCSSSSTATRRAQSTVRRRRSRINGLPNCSSASFRRSTREGYVYRVDYRCEPEGRADAFATSLARFGRVRRAARVAVGVDGPT